MDEVPRKGRDVRRADSTARAAGSKEKSPKKPRKKRKKRSRRPAADGPERLRTALDAAGNQRPVFLLDFPEDPALDDLVAAFEAGNYAYVREHAAAVAGAAKAEDVRRAALELRSRIDPDPLVKYLLAASVALLAFLVAWSYTWHDH